MTIQETMIAKAKLESDIKALIESFEKETGVKVEKVSTHTLDVVAMQGETVGWMRDVVVTVKL